MSVSFDKQASSPELRRKVAADADDDEILDVSTPYAHAATRRRSSIPPNQSWSDKNKRNSFHSDKERSNGSSPL